MNKYKKIFWIDQNSNRDSKDYFDITKKIRWDLIGYAYESGVYLFEDLASASDYLLKLRKEDMTYPSDDYIFIIEPKFKQIPLVYNPLKKEYYETIDNGLDAGIIFYEKVVKDICWFKPPVIYLSIIENNIDNRSFKSLLRNYPFLKDSNWFWKWDNKYQEFYETIKRSLV